MNNSRAVKKKLLQIKSVKTEKTTTSQTRLGAMNGSCINCGLDETE